MRFLLTLTSLHNWRFGLYAFSILIEIEEIRRVERGINKFWKKILIASAEFHFLFCLELHIKIFFILEKIDLFDLHTFFGGT